MQRWSLSLILVTMFLAMVWVTTAASFDRNVVEAAKDLWADPWGRATLFDTYFAFLVIYLFVYFRERNLLARVLWLLSFLTLGNLAIAVYFLDKLRRGENPFQAARGSSS